MQNIKPEYKQEMINSLKKINFNNRLNDMLETAQNIRNIQIAHLLIDNMFDEELKKLKFDELVSISKELNKLLDILSFNIERIILPMKYYLEKNNKLKENEIVDIEKLLNSVALNSQKLHMKDKFPEGWKRMKNKLSDEEIKIINEYRRKLGL